MRDGEPTLNAGGWYEYRLVVDVSGEKAEQVKQFCEKLADCAFDLLPENEDIGINIHGEKRAPNAKGGRNERYRRKTAAQDCRRIVRIPHPDRAGGCRGD